MSRPPLLRSCSRDNLVRAIALLQQTGQTAHIVLFRAVLERRIALASVFDRRAKLTPRMLRDATLPVLVMVGDDDATPTGPDGWRCARSVTAWAHAAVVHGSGATPETYAEAVCAAEVKGRALLIETSSAHVGAWAALMEGKPALAILPRGGTHPVPHDARALH